MELMKGWSTTLKTISVNKKNRNFSSSKGVLYSKDKKTIYIYPSGKSVTNYKLFDKVTTIAPYAFYAADMKSIQLSSKLTTIGECAFQYSTVKTVTGGKKLRVIGQMAFYEADGLTNFAFDSALQKNRQQCVLCLQAAKCNSSGKTGICRKLCVYGKRRIAFFDDIMQIKSGRNLSALYEKNEL